MLAPVKQVKTKVPLSEALIYVADIMEVLEDGSEEDLQALYEDEHFLDTARADFAYAVDRRILADRAFRAAIKMAENAKRDWTERLATIRRAYDSFKQNTMWHMAMHPEVKFAGNEGRLTLQRNGGEPALKLNFETDQLKDIVTDEDVFKYGIPDDAYEQVTIKVLKKDRLAEHIKKNSELELDHLNTPTTTYLAKNNAGTLSRGSHMRVRSV